MLPLALLALAAAAGAVPVVQGTTINGWTVIGVLLIGAAGLAHRLTARNRA